MAMAYDAAALWSTSLWRNLCEQFLQGSSKLVEDWQGWRRCLGLELLFSRGSQGTCRYSDGSCEPWRPWSSPGLRPPGSYAPLQPGDGGRIQGENRSRSSYFRCLEWKVLLGVDQLEGRFLYSSFARP